MRRVAGSARWRLVVIRRAGPTCPRPRVRTSTRARIENFVRDFYRDIAQDDLLGPIFAAAHVDWSAHIGTVTDFWAWQLLGERSYEGNPLRAHEPLHERDPLRTLHFERWLAIFDDIIDAGYQGPQAEFAKQRARRMARAMQRLLTGASELGGVALEPVVQPTSVERRPWSCPARPSPRSVVVGAK